MKTITRSRDFRTHALESAVLLWAGDRACSGIVVFWQPMASEMSNSSRWYGSFVSFLRQNAHRRKEFKRESEDAVCGWCSQVDQQGGPAHLHSGRHPAASLWLQGAACQY